MFDDSRRLRVLYVMHGTLKDPKRGTPIRMRHIALQLQREHELLVCVSEVDERDGFNWISYPTKLGGLKKLFFFLKLIKDNRIQLIVTSTETNIKLPVLIKWFTGVNIAIDLHGIHAEELLFMEKVSIVRASTYGIYVRFFLWFYDLVLPVSNKLGDYYGGWIRRYHAVYGGVDENEFNDPVFATPCGKLVIGYMGNTRRYQGLEELLVAIRTLRLKKEKCPDILLNLVLSGVKKADVTKLLDEYDLTDIAKIHLDVPHDLVGRIITTSSVLVIPRLPLKMTEYAYPSKLPEYLACGVPVITTDVGPVSELAQLVACNPFILIPSEKISEHVFNAIEAISKMSDVERSGYVRCAKELVSKHLLWDIVGDKMNNVLRTI